MNVQLCCDPFGFICDVVTGWPGCAHDYRIFKNSALQSRIEDGSVLNGETVQLRNVDVPQMLIADKGYPLTHYLLVPYRFSRMMSPPERKFNLAHSKSRIIIENTIGRVKAEWKILRDTIRFDIANVGFVITAACVLHNYLQEYYNNSDYLWVLR